MEDVLGVIEQTINKSTIDDFRKYISSLTGHTKWMICSDYCIDDKSKPNDTATFTVLPYYSDILDIQQNIAKHAPTDIKNTRSVTDEFINYQKSGLIFHFSVIFERKPNHVLGHYTKDFMRLALINTIEMLNKLVVNTPPNKEYFEKVIVKANNLLQKMDKKSFNVKLLKQMLIINLLASYIAYIISRETKVTNIAWFSDRDAILDSYQNIVVDLFGMNHHGLCERDKIDDSKIGIFVGKPDNKENENKMWYDELIRLPDFITGTLSDYNFVENLVSKSKFNSMIEGCIADNNNISILKLFFDSGLLKCSRITVASND